MQYTTLLCVIRCQKAAQYSSFREIGTRVTAEMKLNRTTVC